MLDKNRKFTENKSIINAARIISSLANGNNTVTDIAKYCKYNTSTVHRLLQTMKQLDWATQDSINHRYYLGPFFTEISSNQLANHKYLVVHAFDEMAHLSNISEETINITIMVQLQYVLLHTIVSKQSLKVTEMSHQDNMPAFFAGASGKMLLSQLNDEEINEILKKSI
jgi:DNA-binding IclR family transcriptional regulator